VLISSPILDMQTGKKLSQVTYKGLQNVRSETAIVMACTLFVVSGFTSEATLVVHACS